MKIYTRKHLPYEYFLSMNISRFMVYACSGTSLNKSFELRTQ